MSFATVDFKRPSISLEEARQTASSAFGELGRKTIDLWAQYNDDYFDGALEPVPVLYVPTSPYGRWIGLCTGTCDQKTALIYLKANETWKVTRGVLLHEMIHQALIERGENPKHEGQPWCDEIMRLSRALGKKKFWAGRYTVGKEKTADGKRRSFKMNVPGPGGETSITQEEIACWPHSLGITPPDLKVR